mgnify:CR=1 FL=1
MEIVGVLLGIIAIGLIFWFRRNQQKTNELVNTYFDNCETGMNAMMDNFNKYQIETDRKIAELEKQLEIKTKQVDRKTDKTIRNLPAMIGKIVSQIEFAQNQINREQ